MQNCDLGVLQVLSGFILQCLHWSSSGRARCPRVSGSRGLMIHGEVGSDAPVPVIHPSSVLTTECVAWPELRAWYHGLNHYWFQFTRISLAVNGCSWGLWFTVSVRLRSGVWGAFWAQQPPYQVHLLPYKLGTRSWKICYPFGNIYCVLLSICMLECNTEKKYSWKTTENKDLREQKTFIWWGEKAAWKVCVQTLDQIKKCQLLSCKFL